MSVAYVTFEQHSYTDEGGDLWETVKLAGKYEVCPRCRGTGSHVNPSVDGFSISQFDEDPEFAERYFEGWYDVRCEECDGDRVVAVIDEDANDPQLVTDYFKRMKDLAEMEAEDRYWRRMESGGYDW